MEVRVAQLHVNMVEQSFSDVKSRSRRDHTSNDLTTQTKVTCFTSTLVIWFDDKSCCSGQQNWIKCGTTILASWPVVASCIGVQGWIAVKMSIQVILLFL
jgi:hypothetical protein